MCTVFYHKDLWEFQIQSKTVPLPAALDCECICVPVLIVFSNRMEPFCPVLVKCGYCRVLC